MIDLYCAGTPNVLKIEIMLEETGLPYRLLPLNVWKGEQFAPAFLGINPNGKVPAIVDHDAEEGPYGVMESAAILIYLAEKTGRFLPAAGRNRHDVLQWLAFQAANQGPAGGQFVHFQRYAGPGHDYSLNRYRTELHRVYGVMERRLSAVSHLAGSEYSIADMAALPWLVSLSNMFRDSVPFVDIDSALHPALSAWAARCLQRPAVQRALKAHATIRSGLPEATDDDKDRFFGRGRYAHRMA